MNTIDITPTFEAATAICLGCIKHAASISADHPDYHRIQDAAEMSTVEIMRYASELDRLVAAEKEPSDAS